MVVKMNCKMMIILLLNIYNIQHFFCEELIFPGFLADETARRGGRNIFFFLAFFCNVNLCFSSQDYHRYKGCLLFISYFEYKNLSTLTIFFFYKMSITEHSCMIVICKKKREKKYTFLYFCPLRGIGGGSELSGHVR